MTLCVLATLLAGLLAALGGWLVYQLLRQTAALRHGVLDDAELAQTSALALDENLRDMRMVAASLLMPPLQRALREACRRADKEAALRFLGGLSGAGAAQDEALDRRVLVLLRLPDAGVVGAERDAVDDCARLLVCRKPVLAQDPSNRPAAEVARPPRHGGGSAALASSLLAYTFGHLWKPMTGEDVDAFLDSR